MQVEISQLELRYARLRIRDEGQRSKLLASLAKDGQQSPVMVVAGAERERFVLIDGYARVAVLRELARDVVEATVVSLPEADALVKAHRLEGERRRSPLEEGWLLEELMERHGLRLAELATRLGRSKSWVSRRLALVTVLPPAVQDRVRRGQVGAHVATKYLVPLARANAPHCTTLVANLAGHRPTVREMGALYAAWRLGDAEQRARIVRSPKLFLKSLEADEPMDEPAARLLNDLRSLGAIARRSERRVDEGAYRDAASSSRDRLTRAWSYARRSFESLRTVTTRWEEEDARPGNADGDPAPSP
jgi:ParB family chromosome partitioning protein